MLAGALAQERLLLVGTYRNDEIGRGHPLRRLCNDLRRARLLREMLVERLDQAGTAALATHVFGQPPGAGLAATLYERTEGVPLFVKELAGALACVAACGRASQASSWRTAKLCPSPHTPRCCAAAPGWPARIGAAAAPPGRGSWP